MERRSLVLCTFVGFLGLLSAALGFAAEAKRIKIFSSNGYLRLIFG
ncbi:hypothetical protein CK203_024354 [Vitis vinifera]|uniref:Uncharacterized protein n=1 Tax=Vitis vinifera TaxID=29760 RepID=A0A438E1Y5_VITVI|nr:hypothetical protein CK203_082045 [Vitis vinifera]RVX01751.1 hypothetical protein CK203_024354 [Vitis vinifera]